MAAMVNPRRASREISLFDFNGAEVSVMAGFVEGFCSFDVALNYKEKQNIKLHLHEKSTPISYYPRICPIMQSNETIRLHK
jgi:hypothetical protein